MTSYNDFWTTHEPCFVPRLLSKRCAWFAGTALSALATLGCSTHDSKLTAPLAASTAAGMSAADSPELAGTGAEQANPMPPATMANPSAGAPAAGGGATTHSHIPGGTADTAGAAGDQTVSMGSAGGSGSVATAGAGGASEAMPMPAEPSPTHAHGGTAGARMAGSGGLGGNAGMGGSGGIGEHAGMGDGGAMGAAGGGATAGAGGMPEDNSHDHCLVGEVQVPADLSITNKPDYWTASNSDIDLVVPKGVLDWMGQRAWEPSHNAWHNIRRCRGSIIPGASSALCQMTELVPASQECSGPDDGYQFLVMHRHMIIALKQAFRQHTALFDGFAHFPFEAKDVPEEWRDRFGTGWSQSIINTATTLEDIENRLDQFPSEGSLGQYIQCGGNGLSSIHGALHFKWVVNESPYSLGKQTVNIDNFMFWKLHGWIDGIWERYRVAKGLAPDEPKLQQALTEQCHEMHALGVAVGPAMPPPQDEPLPVERGLFHETVRPIFEQICSGCHSESSPEAGMSLGGHISSADVVQNLVNKQTLHGGQYVRVLPGVPEQSWLYLKVSGMAMAAACMGAECNPQTMPPTGQVTLSAEQLEAIRFWIAQGAPMPEQTL